MREQRNKPNGTKRKRIEKMIELNPVMHNYIKYKWVKYLD